VKKNKERLAVEQKEKPQRTHRNMTPVEEKSKRGRWITLLLLALSILLSWLFSL